MKKLLAPLLFATSLFGASAMAATVDFDLPPGQLGGVSNGFTLSSDFVSIGQLPVLEDTGSVTYNAGVFNFGGLTMLGQNFTASGSGGLGQNQADLTISLTFKGLSGQVLASQSFTLSGSGASQNYFTSVAGVHEVDISTGGRGTQLQSFEVMPVPEPETYAMLLAGLGLVGAIARRRATARAA